MDICKSADPRLGKAVVQYAGLVVSLITCFNAGWTSIRWAHHCERPDCCKGIAGAFDPEQMKTKIMQIVMKLLLSSLPSTPEKGKWTKTWPCVTWFLRALCPHGMLRELLAIAGLKQVAAPQHAAPASDATKSCLEIDFVAIRHAERSRCRVCQQARDPAQHYLALCVVGASPISVCLVLEGFQRQTWGQAEVPGSYGLGIAIVEPSRCHVATVCGLATRAQQSVCLDLGFLSRDIRCMEHGSSTATFCSSQSPSGVAVLVVYAIQLLETVAAQIVADGR